MRWQIVLSFVPICARYAPIRGELAKDSVCSCAGLVGSGQPSSSVVISMAFVSAIYIGLPHQISGPLRGCRSAAISVAMLRVMIEGQNGVLPL